MKINVEFDPKELSAEQAKALGALFTDSANAAITATGTSKATSEAKAPAKEEKPAAPKTEAPKAAAKATFADLDEAGQLAAIQTEVTRHAKKGKTADVKAILVHFGAGKASELDAERYGEVYDAFVRYGKGETVDAITGVEDLA